MTLYDFYHYHILGGLVMTPEDLYKIELESINDWFSYLNNRLDYLYILRSECRISIEEENEMYQIEEILFKR